MNNILNINEYIQQLLTIVCALSHGVEIWNGANFGISNALFVCKNKNCENLYMCAYVKFCHTCIIIQILN